MTFDKPAVMVEKALDRYELAIVVTWPDRTTRAVVSAIGGPVNRLIDLYVAIQREIRDGTAEGRMRWESAQTAVQEALSPLRSRSLR